MTDHKWQLALDMVGYKLVVHIPASQGCWNVLTATVDIYLHHSKIALKALIYIPKSLLVLEALQYLVETAYLWRWYDIQFKTLRDVLLLKIYFKVL